MFACILGGLLEVLGRSRELFDCSCKLFSWFVRSLISLRARRSSKVIRYGFFSTIRNLSELFGKYFGLIGASLASKWLPSMDYSKGEEERPSGRSQRRLGYLIDCRASVNRKKLSIPSVGRARWPKGIGPLPIENTTTDAATTTTMATPATAATATVVLRHRTTRATTATTATAACVCLPRRMRSWIQSYRENSQPAPPTSIDHPSLVAPWWSSR